jgi:hypothetical protein
MTAKKDEAVPEPVNGELPLVQPFPEAEASEPLVQPLPEPPDNQAMCPFCGLEECGHNMGGPA